MIELSHLVIAIIFLVAGILIGIAITPSNVTLDQVPPQETTILPDNLSNLRIDVVASTRQDWSRQNQLIPTILLKRGHPAAGQMPVETFSFSAANAQQMIFGIQAAANYHQDNQERSNQRPHLSKS